MRFVWQLHYNTGCQTMYLDSSKPHKSAQGQRQQANEQPTYGRLIVPLLPVEARQKGLHSKAHWRRNGRKVVADKSNYYLVKGSAKLKGLSYPGQVYCDFLGNGWFTVPRSEDTRETYALWSFEDTQPVKQRATKPKDLTPIQWLRERIGKYDIGRKVTYRHKTTGKRKKHPVHLNKRQEIQDYRNKKLSKLKTLTNKDFNRHFAGQETCYFTASSLCAETLLYLDLDNHDGQKSAKPCAAWLRDHYLPGLYFEASDNGVRCFPRVKIDCANSTQVRLYAKKLNRWLKYVTQGWGLTEAAIKGTPEQSTWDQHSGQWRTRCGVLGALPRDVKRFEDWQRSTLLTFDDIDRLEATVPKGYREPSNKQGSNRDSGNCHVDERHLLAVAWLKKQHALPTLRKGRLTDKHVATLLAQLEYCSKTPNPDGSLPVARIEALHNVMSLDFAYDPERTATVCRWLTALGKIDVKDNRYWYAPKKDLPFSVRGGGQARRWGLTQEALSEIEGVRQVKLFSGNETLERETKRETYLIRSISWSPTLVVEYIGIRPDELIEFQHWRDQLRLSA